MRCPQCGTENPEGAYFCGGCGYQIRSAISQSKGPVDDVSGGLEEEKREQPAPPSGLPTGETGTQAHPSAPPQAPMASPPRPQPPPNAYTPGAGIAPPPPQPGQYQQPTGGYGYSAYPPQPGYGYMPPDGNTSGMGDGYFLPPEASGWTFAGFVPFGIYAFINGITLWGVLGLLGHFVPLLSIICWIYIGIQGKELAWRNRRFDSVQQYTETMRAWNMWGIALLLMGAVVIVLYFVLIFAVMFAAMSDPSFYAQ